MESVKSLLDNWNNILASLLKAKILDDVSDIGTVKFNLQTEVITITAIKKHEGPDGCNLSARTITVRKDCVFVMDKTTKYI